MVIKLLLSALIIINLGCAVKEPIIDLKKVSALNVENNPEHLNPKQLNSKYTSAEAARMKAKIIRVTADLNITEQADVKEVSVIKYVQIKVVELQDSQGLKYVGGEIYAADLGVYLAQLEHILGEDFSAFRENQAIRDHHTFHMTLVNPYEFQTLTKTINYGDVFSVTLFGLGKVVKANKNIKEEKNEAENTKVNKMKTTYFVVAQSSEAQYFRQKLLLQPKDFHVTLGFSPKDVYGVRKNKETLIYKLPESILQESKLPLTK